MIKSFNNNYFILFNIHKFYVLTIILFHFSTIQSTNYSQIHLDTTNKGSEIIVIDNIFHPEHVYHFEDFFWTGSGDGAQDSIDDSKHFESATTIIVTSTVTSTLLITPTDIIYTTVSDQTITDKSTNNNCVYNCDEPSTPADTIKPTPTTQLVDTTYYIPSIDETTTTHETRTDNVITTTEEEEEEEEDKVEREITTIGVTTSTKRYQIPSDRRYWILTILETRIPSADDTNVEVDSFQLPTLEELEDSLAVLYQIAFYRQQQKHLGIENNNGLNAVNGSKHAKQSQSRSNIQTVRLPTVQVQIHNLTTIEHHHHHNHVDEIELIYSVRVAGQPIPAKTAATDMRLISDVEMIKELGYTIRTKAEPYVKDETQSPLGLADYDSKWIFIGTGLSLLVLLLLLLILITLVIRKRSTAKLLNEPLRQDDDGGGVVVDTTDIVSKSGQINLGFSMEDAQVQTTCGANDKHSYLVPITKRQQHSRRVLTSGDSNSTTSSSSSSSSIAEYRWRNERPIGNIHTKSNMYSPSAIKQPTLEDNDYKDVVDAKNIVTIRRASANNDIRSTNSYLSMPSVKNFPRGSIPEPLSRVLEPVSVRHLDDGAITPIESPAKALIRHGSMQEAEDPGVIGPLVWSQHVQRLQHVVDKEVNDVPNVGRMKKRFQELLDDAFSLFGGSRSVSPEDVQPTSKQNRSQSAYPRLSADTETKLPPIQPRPKTSGAPARSGGDHHHEPRRAWGSGAPSPLIRPLSAGCTARHHRPTLAPHVCPVRILPEGRLDSTDPAVPVLAAIKGELKKCGQSTSTTIVDNNK